MGTQPDGDFDQIGIGTKNPRISFPLLTPLHWDVPVKPSKSS